MNALKRLMAGAALLTSAWAWAAVDINTASAKELEKLNGIGPAKALAIVTYRDKNGPFKSVDDLTKVEGIGAKTLADIRNAITATPPTQ